ncbi:GFA family protein [Pedomonas mirosovicensis]|uniref:GFA family protein n=1 Tax=Pedomonas mirosovicensis TaxID=2908641 RepID=UPI0021672B7E|nr:GFA family protein [Pedomonas mirosovicensis]MCH8683927.1 GFA family protein [Pedomonas mirosovicensis]
MEQRTATCRCGQLQATCKGEPIRVSVCHCLECQKRSGSSFGAQARWPEAQVTITGRAKTWQRAADSGRKATYRFCPDCGSTIAYTNEAYPGVVAVPIGAFADPLFPSPKFSVYEHRKHPWVAILGDEVERSAT